MITYWRTIIYQKIGGLHLLRYESVHRGRCQLDELLISCSQLNY